MTSGRGMVAGLAVTQTIAYGTLYYAFAVLLTPLAANLRTSTTTVTGAFTASVLTSALFAVPVGRWPDRHGGRALMTAGSLGGVLLLPLSPRPSSPFRPSPRCCCRSSAPARPERSPG